MRSLLFYVMTVMAPLLTSLSLPMQPSYRAAVYDHRPVFPSVLPVSRSTAVRNMMANVEIYETQARTAASQGADIIVFPEDGLYGVQLSRRVIRPYLEPIPDPRATASWAPCSDPARVTPSDILTKLSCIARDNSMYVVANMGDIQPCNSSGENVTAPCPPDGHYQYNTDVVFDPTGQLVARYHKRTLFDERQFDTPPAEHVTFDTPFGRFGVFTCFDILFYDPAVILAEQGIDNILLPTAWSDSYPLLDAVGFHSAWARRHRLNVLAANLHLPQYRFVGSGAYGATGALAFRYNRAVGSGGSLIVVDVPTCHASDVSSSLSARSVESTRREDLFLDDLGLKQTHHPAVVQHMLQMDEAVHFDKTISGDVFRMVEANRARGEVSVCKGRTCCRLRYARNIESTADRQASQDYFAFGAFEGMHQSAHDWYFEACVLVRCTNSSHSSCGELTWDSSTVFSSVVISGTFSTDYIYPEVLVSDGGQVALTAPEEWQFGPEGTLTATRLTKPLLTAALYARNYSKDPQ